MAEVTVLTPEQQQALEDQQHKSLGEKIGDALHIHHDPKPPETVTIETVAPVAQAAPTALTVAPAPSALSKSALGDFRSFTAATVTTGAQVATSTKTITIPKEGWWKHLELDFESLWNKSAKVESTASGVIKVVAPFVVLLAGMVGGSAASTAATTIISAIQTDLATASTVITQIGVSSTFTQAIAAVQNNLQALLALVHVENPTVVNDVQAVIAMINTTLAELQTSTAAA